MTYVNICAEFWHKFGLLLIYSILIHIAEMLFLWTSWFINIDTGQWVLRPYSTTAKFFARNRVRNMDGCTWVILLNLHSLFAFAVSRTDFYSLAKQTFFSRSPIYLYCACTISFRAKCFAFRREKALVESGLYAEV